MATTTEALADLDRFLADPAVKAPEAPEVVSRTKTIVVRYQTGDGEIYEGVLHYEVPGIRQLRAIGLRQAELTVGLPLDPFAAELVSRIAYLEITINRANNPNLPPWWSPLDLPDPALLNAVFKEARTHEARFRERGRDLRPGSEPGAPGDA